MRNNRIKEFIKNPKKALFTLAFPVIIGMVFQTLYNVIDTAFVGRLGADSIAALTFSFPIFFFLMAINSGIGTGMGSIISRSLGASRQKDAENAAMHGILLSIGLAFVLFISSWFLLEDIFVIFGASDAVIPLALGYMRIILLSVFFMLPAFVMHAIFANEGNTKTPVMIQIAALGLNIVLDPIFIFVLGLGVAGAAYATLIAFFFSMVMYIYFIRTRSSLVLRFSKLKLRKSVVVEIFRVGTPASIMMVLMSIYIMFLNRFMAHFSTEHVAAFGLASRLESFVAMPVAGFSLALLTLSGMFYGAKKYDILKSTISYGVKISGLAASIIGLIFFIAPGIFLRIFTNDLSIIDIGSAYMRVNVFTFPLMAVGFCISRSLQGMGFGLPGLIINLTRIIFVAVPLAYVFVYILGLGYIWIAYATIAGGIVANIIAVTWLKVKFRNLDSQ